MKQLMCIKDVLFCFSFDYSVPKDFKINQNFIEHRNRIIHRVLTMTSQHDIPGNDS